MSLRDGILSNTFVTTKIGFKRKEYQVHKDLICYHSPCFDAAFNGTFREGEEGMLELADTAEHVFGLFLDWMYFGRFPSYDEENDEEDDEEDDDEGYDPPNAERLYVFADR